MQEFMATGLFGFFGFFLVGCSFSHGNSKSKQNFSMNTLNHYKTAEEIGSLFSPAAAFPALVHSVAEL